jgi:hypothetical protein
VRARRRAFDSYDVLNTGGLWHRIQAVGTWGHLFEVLVETE